MHIGRVHHLTNYQYVKQYEHPKFCFEQCGWCHREAIPEIVYEDRQLKLLYNKYLCDNEECKTERKKYNPRSYYAPYELTR